MSRQTTATRLQRPEEAANVQPHRPEELAVQQSHRPDASAIRRSTAGERAA
ncbi:hypothetical protein [Paroceanicella profunda]|uniref:hypothetical protein n=1 Tax=Paroceanicella profunda TaxID=2579971 RepID=UPI0014790253|nr:hypothetical protein [Paroceanicella profunda]